ncbi:hypothetical protein HPB48_020805 [Haemaphysalis longicornis]|uniref:Uncharacterized protein n=1 Tax=Haemaphysalis longicornis TaxID=44386 RepID=A0A9J6H355_HAELO|nr:hypothetical protein HPB48_020805 [Haemaphysalis longicornis]
MCLPGRYGPSSGQLSGGIEGLVPLCCTRRSRCLLWRICLPFAYPVMSELQDLKTDLYEAQSTSAVLNKELQHLVLQLHSAQLQVSAQMGHAGDSTAIKQKLEQEMTSYRLDLGREMQLEAEAAQLRKENAALRRDIVSLQSEVFGAKLAAKYLDKELAGRIQQIQLLGRDLNPTEHDRLWNQLESEIHLHRHKAVIRACRGRSATGLPGPPGTALPDEGTPLRRNQASGTCAPCGSTRAATRGWASPSRAV